MPSETGNAHSERFAVNAHRERSGMRLLTAPNLISSLRLALVPVLLCLAWNERPLLFLGFFAFSLFSDSVDGFIARKLNHVTEFGASLDSWADLVMYMSLPACAWWLWRVLRCRLRDPEGDDLAYGASVGATCTLLLTLYALMYDNTVLVVGLLWAYRRFGQVTKGARRWAGIGLLIFMHSVLFWAGPAYDGYWLILAMAALLLLLRVRGDRRHERVGD